MFTSHVSCSVIHHTQQNHSIVSIAQDNDTDDRCSNCSSHDDEEHQHHRQKNCQNCNSSRSSSNGSDISRVECSHCSDHDHVSSQNLVSSSSSSSIHHNYHPHHDNCSEKSSWQEDMKSSSTISSYSSSTCNNACQHHRPHTKNEYNKKNTNKSTHNKNVIEPIHHSNTTSSLHSSKKRKQQRPKYGCFRSNTTSKMSVFFIFFIIVLGAVTTFFCWPRTPRVSMGGGVDASSLPDWWAGTRPPSSFSPQDIPMMRPSLRATWQINVTLDNHDNWIPTHIKSLDFVLMDSLTLSKFAWASSGIMELQPGRMSPLNLTFSVNYQAPDHMDPTFQNLYNACGPLKSPSDQRPALNVLLKVYFHIFGIMWTPIVTATPYLGGILCPIK